MKVEPLLGLTPSMYAVNCEPEDLYIGLYIPEKVKSRDAVETFTRGFIEADKSEASNFLYLY